MAGLQANIYAAVAITWAAALLALIARIAARRITKVTWWIDDYFCLCAFAFATGYSIILIIWTTNWYLGQLLPDTLTEERREDILLHSRLMQYCISLTYSFSIAASKVSVLAFYWRIFKLSAIRIPIQIMFVVTAIWFILRIFLVVFHCIPIQAYWDHSITKKKCDVNDTQFFFGTCLTHFLMDIIIVVLPVIEVFKLRLRLGQKFAVAALFTLGFIVCLASVFVIVESIRYDVNTTQMPRDMALNDTWGVVEINMAVVSACFPLLRPIFRHILPASFLSSGGSSYPTTHISGTRPTGRSIRLTTINKTSKGIDADDSSSTHQLADPEQGLHGSSDFEPMRSDGKKGGFQTVITTQDRGLQPFSGHGVGGGIHVDTTVEVEKFPQSHTYELKR